MKLALVALCLLLVTLAALAAWLYTPDEPREALETRYGATPADFLPVDGLRLYVRDTGPRDAPAIILLHGFGSSLQTWDGWAAALSGHHRVIRFDLPGFGLTGADPTGDYSDRRAVQVLADLMDRLGLARASLAGNSLGGKIAWNFAATYPNRVDRLVLISPDGFASPGFDYGKPAQVPPLLRLLPYTLPKAMLGKTIAPAFGDPAALTPPLLTRYYDMMRAPGVRTAMVARMRQVLLAPPEPALHRITAPTLLIWGERDAMIPHSNAADYLRNIPNARLVSFPTLGHVPQEEAPAESVAPVAAFLDEHVK
jgi:pimeloyl-ACP methyl ester carboxylesterase